jgi:hypothetical protein
MELRQPRQPPDWCRLLPEVQDIWLRKTAYILFYSNPEFVVVPPDELRILIQISIFRSPGFSRIRRSRQDTTAPAGIPPAKAGTPGWHIRIICLNFIRQLGANLEESVHNQCRVAI